MTATSPQSAPPNPPESEAPASWNEETATAAGFDQAQWDESRSDESPATAGGRTVLAAALSLLAVLWIAYTAWSAGRALGTGAITAPAVAQWIAVAAGPLALLGLGWLMFGRTRRKEAERFTRSVVTMRTEARSLEALLEVLSQRINDSRSELTMISQHLMQLGDEATGKLGGITREFDSSTEKLMKHGVALDRAAEAARTDIAVLLDDLPRAEGHARAISEQLRGAAKETADRTEQFDRQLAALTERSREADDTASAASRRLVANLADIENAGAAAAARVGEAETSFSAVIDLLLDRTSTTLDEIRGGIDVQAAAVTALVEQASAGIGRAGVDAAEALGSNVNSANNALDALSGRVAEQQRASQHMIAEIERALGELEQRFAAVAESGDDRAARFLEAVGRSRSELEAMGQHTDAQHQSLESLSERTQSLQALLERLSATIRAQLSDSLEQAGGRAEHLVNSTRSIRPEIEWIRDAANEAGDRLGATGSAIAKQQDGLSALLGSLDDGVGGAEERLANLASAISSAQIEAAQLSGETGPALVQAMVQVKEAAAQAAERAREAIATIIPESAEGLSDATRVALEQVIRDSVEQRLREVETVAAQAVDSARAATGRLTEQMLVLGQSATALEQHIEKQDEERREADSEAFARRVALLIDSMHSASIDVGKILSDEADEKAWDSYLKGDRGVFTRRAARLIGSTEAKAIRSHYDSDGEFQQSANRYIHDFEAMLRRVMAERDGGPIAVTLMSSDMGKLYAALSDAIDRRR
jgi:predicted  nucleic acid-binding Zn-ribbon protein